jgi:hypothetical protein
MVEVLMWVPTSQKGVYETRPVQLPGVPRPGDTFVFYGDDQIWWVEDVRWASEGQSGEPKGVVYVALVRKLGAEIIG